VAIAKAKTKKRIPHMMQTWKGTIRHTGSVLFSFLGFAPAILLLGFPRKW
jgi:hypothetical protein